MNPTRPRAGWPGFLTDRLPVPTILCWGGIGDTLRNLALVPHAAIHRATGVRCRVVHRNWRDLGCLEVAGPPEPDFFRRLIDRVPSLEWRGESGEHRGLPRVVNRVVRSLLRVLHGGRPPYIATEFCLTGEEESALAAFPDGPMLGVQTHLGGMRTKRWGLDRWREFLRLVVERFPRLDICLLDAAPEVGELRCGERIFTTRGLDLAQSIRLCRRFALVVSVCSWVKYVAAWNRTPQVIIVPDQRPEYPASTAKNLAAADYGGILGHPANTVIGLETHRGQPRLTLPSMNDLTPAALFDTVAPRLAALGF